MTQERLVDTEVAALILGLTQRRIQQLVHAGVLTNHGTTRTIRLQLDDIERFRLTCG